MYYYFTLTLVAIDVKMLKLHLLCTFIFSPLLTLPLSFTVLQKLHFSSNTTLPQRLTSVIANTIKSRCHWTIIGYSSDFLYGFFNFGI